METIFYLEIGKNKDVRSDETGNRLCIRKSAKFTGLIYVSVPEQMGASAALVDWLLPFWIHSSEVSTVYDASFLEWIRCKNGLPMWRNNWPFPEYCGYHQKQYADHLLRQAVDALNRAGNGSDIQDRCIFHMYILGYERLIPQVLQPYISRIKSLTFVLGVKDDRKMLEEYLEDLYEEEGLAANCVFFAPEQMAGSSMFFYQKPAVVLDLTGDARRMLWEQGDGICWIDMDSLDEKRKRFAARCSEAVYFSMKEIWKKECFRLW